MPITKEQIDQFLAHPVPPGLMLATGGSPVKILRGKEALMTKVTDSSGNEWAFKWYASLSSQTISQKHEYGDGVNHDEAALRSLSLTAGQVPDSKFFLYPQNKEHSGAELYAIQPWIDGRSLRDVPFTEIIRTRRLRRNLGALFILCGRLYEKEGITPDLTGGKRINLFGHDVVDPTGFLWPFRTTNIIVRGDRPIIVDARHNDPGVHPLKRLAVLTHRRISQLTGQILLRL